MSLLSKKISTVTMAVAVSALLSACQTTAPGHDQRNAKIDSVMAAAAADARTQGNMQQSLSILESMYKQKSNDPATALNYAHALREQGYYNRASLVLAPFAKDESIKDADLNIEYSSIQAAMGNYMEAEAAGRRAVLLAPESGKAYHVLGVALDAQGHHEQAQVAFEKGLDHWEGDPSPILNNIGLNLAAQGFLDEAIETLRKAMDTAPNRKEIERNLRIVSALQYQPPRKGTRLIPKPPKKPVAGEYKVDVLEEPDDVTVDSSAVIEVEQEEIDAE